jgi:hypothetical protein
VPAFKQCGTGANPADGKHSAPFSLPTCLPPGTTGTAHIGNGGSGEATVTVVPGNLATPADEADARITATISDVRSGSGGGTDYNPASGADMTLISKLRITDTRYGTLEVEPGTTTDIRFEVPLTCATTSDSSVGSTCSVNTTADAIVPGTIAEGKKTVIGLFRVQIDDAGPDNVRDNADDSLFAQQGYYVP